eukprot:gene10894-22744_t
MKSTPVGSEIPPDSLFLLEDVISKDEEMIIMSALQPALSKKKYQGNHWDDVIIKYKEYELNNNLTKSVHLILSTVAKKVMEVCRRRMVMLPPHVIELHEDGHIGPHVDSVKFSGDVVAGLSLLSTRVMRLKPAPETEITESHIRDASDADSLYYPQTVDLLLRPRSLYVLTGALRYRYTHEVLGKQSVSGEAATSTITNNWELPPPHRRLSVIIRDQHPSDEDLIVTKRPISYVGRRNNKPIKRMNPQRQNCQWFQLWLHHKISYSQNQPVSALVSSMRSVSFSNYFQCLTSNRKKNSKVKGYVPYLIICVAIWYITLERLVNTFPRTKKKTVFYSAKESQYLKYDNTHMSSIGEALRRVGFKVEYILVIFGELSLATNMIEVTGQMMIEDENVDECRVIFLDYRLHLVEDLSGVEVEEVFDVILYGIGRFLLWIIFNIVDWKVVLGVGTGYQVLVKLGGVIIESKLCFGGELWLKYPLGGNCFGVRPPNTKQSGAIGSASNLYQGDSQELMLFSLFFWVLFEIGNEGVLLAVFVLGDLSG